MPSFETITRCRRLIQSKGNKKHQSSEYVENNRGAKQEFYSSMLKNSHLN